jgi:hypothetical protein
MRLAKQNMTVNDDDDEDNNNNTTQYARLQLQSQWLEKQLKQQY